MKSATEIDRIARFATARVQPHGADPRQWTYKDTGATLTTEDANIFLDMEHADWQAFKVSLSELVVEAEVAASVTRQAHDLVKMYFDEYPECRTTSEIYRYMTPAHRAEFIELARAMAATD